MDLSTSQRFNERCRGRNSSRNDNRHSKIRASDESNVDNESENEEVDIFNNEAMENPGFNIASKSNSGAPGGPSQMDNDQFQMKGTITVFKVKCKQLLL